MLANHSSQALTIGSIDAVKLQQLVLQCLPNINALRNKELVLVIGRTKSGKSTAINYLMGANLVKYTTDDGEILAKLVESQVEYAPIGAALEAHALAPRSYNHPTEGITYCDMAGFDDHCPEEYRVCIAGLMQAGIQIAASVKMVMVTIDVGLLYADFSGCELRGLAELLSNITQDISALAKNLMFILTKANNQSVSQVISKIKKRQATLERYLEDEQKVLEQLTKGSQASNILVDKLERHQNEVRLIQAEMAIIQLINVDNTFCLNIFDDGESRRVINSFLQIRKTQAHIPKVMFNFERLTDDSISFSHAVNQLASEAANLLESRLSLPAQLWNEKENITDVTNRIAYLQYKLTEDNIDAAEFEQHRVRNLEIVTKMQEKQACCIADIAYLKKLIEFLTTDDTLIRFSVVKSAWSRVRQGVGGRYSTYTIEIKNAQTIVCTCDSEGNCRKNCGKREKDGKYNDPIVSIVRRIRNPSKRFWELWQGKDALLTEDKRKALDLEPLSHLSDFFPTEIWEGHKSDGVIEGVRGFFRADDFEGIDYFGRLQCQRPVHFIPDEGQNNPIDRMYYSYTRCFPNIGNHITKLNERIRSIEKMIPSIQGELVRLEKFRQFANTRMTRQQNLENCISIQAKLMEKIATLETTLMTVKEQINLDANLYDIVFNIAPLSNSDVMTEFVKKYTLYMSLSTQERDNGLFLAMRKFYINPDKIDWSPTAKQLGQGEMVKVYKRSYKVMQNSEPIDVAVKQIFTNAPTSALVQEAQVMAGFSQHPNIVHFYGITQSPQTCVSFYAIVMECMKCSLYDILYDRNISDQMLTFDWRKKIASQIVAAVIYLHEASVLHCDIKSLNILLSENQQTAKLTDFGISKSVTTVTNAVGGSLYWLAPEMDETGATKATDIFALGIVIAEIVNRKIPFKGEILPYQYHEKIQGGLLVFSDKFPKLSTLGQDCIKISPNERPTAQQCQTRLQFKD